MRIEITPSEFADLINNIQPSQKIVDPLTNAMEIYRDGRKLEAIKLIRESYGFGLKVSKDLMEIVFGERHLGDGY